MEKRRNVLKTVLILWGWRRNVEKCTENSADSMGEIIELLRNVLETVLIHEGFENNVRLLTFIDLLTIIDHFWQE